MHHRDGGLEFANLELRKRFEVQMIHRRDGESAEFLIIFPGRQR
jgi:hypothetical protein